MTEEASTRGGIKNWNEGISHRPSPARRKHTHIHTYTTPSDYPINENNCPLEAAAINHDPRTTTTTTRACARNAAVARYGRFRFFSHHPHQGVARAAPLSLSLSLSLSAQMCFISQLNDANVQH